MRFASRGLLCIHGFVGTEANIGVVPMGFSSAFPLRLSSRNVRLRRWERLQQVLGLGSLSVYLESTDTVILGEEVYHLLP